MANGGWSRRIFPDSIRHSRFDTQRLLNFLNLFDGTFASENDEIAAEVTSEFNSSRARDGHLGGGVNRKIGRQGANQPRDPDVLHDRGIYPGGDDGCAK